MGQKHTVTRDKVEMLQTDFQMTSRFLKKCMPVTIFARSGYVILGLLGGFYMFLQGVTAYARGAEVGGQLLSWSLVLGFTSLVILSYTRCKESRLMDDFHTIMPRISGTPTTTPGPIRFVFLNSIPFIVDIIAVIVSFQSINEGSSPWLVVISLFVLLCHGMLSFSMATDKRDRDFKMKCDENDELLGKYLKNHKVGEEV